MGREAGVACEIASGYMLRRIAAHSRRSVKTARAPLKSVLGKPGLARQADLVALLGLAGLPISEYLNIY